MRFVPFCWSLCFARAPPNFTNIIPFQLEYVSEDHIPRNIHLALSGTKEDGKNGMTVSWETSGECYQTAFVRFGTESNQLDQSVSSSKTFVYTTDGFISSCISHVTIPPSMLESEKQYYYQCGNTAEKWSEVLSFTTPPSYGSKTPVKIALTADLGLSEHAIKTMNYIASENSLSCVIVAGDLSYANGHQLVWKNWLARISTFAARLPMMVIAGNHEEEPMRNPEIDRFNAYQSLFRMPFPKDSPDRNLYYSMQMGPIYIIYLTPYIDTSAPSPQFQWLRKEFEAIDRSKTPWLMIVTHGCFYHSNSAHQKHSEPHYKMKENMEGMFYLNHVDLVVCGHVHAFERTKPMFNGEVVEDGVIYYTVGVGGTHEGLAKRFLSKVPKWSAVRKASYGYSIATVTSTTLQLDWYTHTSESAKLEDSLTLQKTETSVAQQ